MHAHGLWAVSLLAFCLSSRVDAIGQASCVSFASGPSLFPVVNGGQLAPVYVSGDDWPGVQRAAGDFVSDIKQVTGKTLSLKNISSVATIPKSSEAPIIIGTLGHSSLIDEIVNNTQLDVSSISGKWEAYISKQVSNPLPGISSAYVIIGSDKRGAVYAIYDHTEQFGVSPWYWYVFHPLLRFLFTQ